MRQELPDDSPITSFFWSKSQYLKPIPYLYSVRAPILLGFK